MAQVDRQQAVLSLLQNLRDLDGLKKLFWEELNYERENKPLSTRQWSESAKCALADEPVLFASGGEENAFHVVYCRLASAESSISTTPGSAAMRACSVSAAAITSEYG